MKNIHLLTSLIIVCCLLPVSAYSEQIVFTAADAHPVAADLAKPDRKVDRHVGVLLLPMYRHTGRSWQPLIRHLIGAGFTCLSLDLRGHGRSRYAADGSDDGQRVLARDPALFNAMFLDAAAADRWLRQRVPDLQKTVLIGASVGCSVAVHAVSNGSVRADGLVLMTPGENYLGVPTMEHIKNWPGIPVLLLSSEEEQNRGAAAIYEQLRNNGAALQIFSQTGIHGTRMFGEVQGVETLITDWLVQVVGR